MAQLGYDSQTVTVNGITDRLLLKPEGSGGVSATPTVPGAVFLASVNTGSPSYTKGSSTQLTLTFASNPGFTTSSLAGVAWADSGGTNHYLLDCTITSVTGPVVVITAPVSIPAGQTNFASVTANVTEITVAIATLATGDLPSNPDINDYVFPSATLLQLLMTCGKTGAFELFATPTGSISDSADGVWVGSTTKTLTPSNAPGWVAGALVGLPVTVNSVSVGTVVSNTTTQITTTINGSVGNGTYSWAIGSPNSVLSWNYAYSGNFYNWITGQSSPFAGNVTKLRFYNFDTTNQVMSVAGLLS